MFAARAFVTAGATVPPGPVGASSGYVAGDGSNRANFFTGALLCATAAGARCLIAPLIAGVVLCATAASVSWTV
jgi:hypothetical protein